MEEANRLYHEAKDATRALMQKKNHDYGEAWRDMRISSLADKPRVALLSTNASHCLVDVLQRWRSGELPCDIACVIANHPEMGEYAGWYDVPFHHVDFKRQSKAEAFKEVDALLDLLVKTLVQEAMELGSNI